LGYLITKTVALDEADNPVIRTVGEFIPVGQLSLGFWLNKRE